MRNSTPQSFLALLAILLLASSAAALGTPKAYSLKATGHHDGVKFEAKYVESSLDGIVDQTFGIRIEGLGAFAPVHINMHGNDAFGVRADEFGTATLYIQRFAVPTDSSANGRPNKRLDPGIRLEVHDAADTMLVDGKFHE